MASTTAAAEALISMSTNNASSDDDNAKNIEVSDEHDKENTLKTTLENQDEEPSSNSTVAAKTAIEDGGNNKEDPTTLTSNDASNENSVDDIKLAGTSASEETTEGEGKEVIDIGPSISDEFANTGDTPYDETKDDDDTPDAFDDSKEVVVDGDYQMDKITVIVNDAAAKKKENDEEEIEEEEEDAGGPSASSGGESFQKITKIDDRLSYAVSQVGQNVQNRSPDIVPLAKEYNAFRKKLRLLVTSAKKYHDITMQQNNAKAELVKQLSILSANSPLYDHVGKTVGAVTTAHQGDGDLCEQQEEATEVKHQENPCSLAYMHNNASKNVQMDCNDFNANILDYAVEWETIVTKRIDNDLNEVKRLQRTRLHYENKVSGLRQKVNRIESKGKEVPQAMVEKLERNEQKLQKAFQAHEIRSAQLCVIIEEATHSGWKDLYPLVEHILKWDETRLARENEAYTMIPTTLKSITAVAAAANAGSVMADVGLEAV